jgi:DNA-binding MarR family transcriptional regulator
MRETTEGQEEADLKAVEDAVGYHLRRAQTVVLDDVVRRLRPLGIGPPEFTVMSVMQTNPGIHATRLAESLPMKRSNLSVLLARLRRRGLICRNDGEDFGRVQALRLTPEGLALLEKARSLHGEHLKLFESILGKEGMARLIKMLRKLANYRPESA